jgi:DNA (cytosine-5)-methyltransferase 1
MSKPTNIKKLVLEQLMILSKTHKLRVGTDCSGIEAPIQALIQLGYPFEHKFSCDNNKHCIQSIVANYKPEIIFGYGKEGDITKRDIQDVPDIDLYICGFPCQPFSVAGDRKGMLDIRGNVFYGCIKVIDKKLPKFFILENVSGLLSARKGKDWIEILKTLRTLEDDHGYNISWKIINTKDYGIPQNRKRLYIVGRLDGKQFEWPKPIGSGAPLSTYVDRQDTKKDKPSVRQQKILNRMNGQQFINISFGQNTYREANKIAPCLLADSIHWCVPMGRQANVKELLKLQGFPTDFKQVVSTRQLKKQIGNSMSVNVLKALIKELTMEKP